MNTIRHSVAKLVGTISLVTTMATVPIFLAANLLGESLGLRAGIALLGYAALVTQFGAAAVTTSSHSAQLPTAQ